MFFLCIILLSDAVCRACRNIYEAVDILLVLKLNNSTVTLIISSIVGS